MEGEQLASAHLTDGRATWMVANLCDQRQTAGVISGLHQQITDAGENCAYQRDELNFAGNFQGVAEHLTRSLKVARGAKTVAQPIQRTGKTAAVIIVAIEGNAEFIAILRFSIAL